MKYALGIFTAILVMGWMSCEMGTAYQPASLVVFTKDGCPRCAEAKEILQARGRGFIEKNISNPQHREEMWNLLHQKSQGETVRLVMPVVVVEGEVYYNLPQLNPFFSGI